MEPLLTTPVTGRLKVPGATLHFEVRGRGPLLVLLPGGGGDAGVYAGFGVRLADAYTVATLDPRGYSRSTLDGPPRTQRVGTQADDTLALIRHLTDMPAYVLGGSSGALVALDLLARHPRSLVRVIAHEPPAFSLLPGAAEHRAFVEDVHATFRREGMGAAGAQFAEGVGATGDHWEPAPELARRLMGNGPDFLEHELRSFTSYLPDVAALRPAAEAGQLVLAAGTTSRGKLSYLPAAHLARELSLELAHFPGGHSGWLPAEAESATLVRDLFARP